MFEFEFHQISGLQPSLLANRLRLNEKSLVLLFAKIELLENGCWLWLGAKRKGYGAVRIRALSAQVIQVHRLTYQLVHGLLDPELDIHHKTEEGCIGPSCCNPGHMQPTTKAEHTTDLTPRSIAYISAHRDHCKRGHLYTEDNVRVLKNGVRQCRQCDKFNAQNKRDRAQVRPKFAKDPAKLKTHCFRGHEYSEDNTGWIDSKSGPQRICLACQRIRNTTPPSERVVRPKNQCKRGHVLEGDNVYLHPDGVRKSCLVCRKLNFSKSTKSVRERNKVAAPLPDQCPQGHVLNKENLYFYATPTGPEKRCRACEAVASQRRMAGKSIIQPTTDVCKKGHPLEGNNLAFRTNGYAKCLACANEATKKYQRDNREVHLTQSKVARERRQAKAVDALNTKILEALSHQDDDEMLARLKQALDDFRSR